MLGLAALSLSLSLPPVCATGDSMRVMRRYAVAPTSVAWVTCGDAAAGKIRRRIPRAGARGCRQRLELMVMHQVDPWIDDGEPDRRTKRLVAAFKTTYPEYQSVFGGSVARAYERGTNRGFGTVDPP